MKKKVALLLCVGSLLFANDTLEKFDKGMAYLLGQGVTQDKHKALQLLGEASKEGSAEAQYNLALMYYSGDGVEQNITKSAHLLEASAQQGYTKAVANVGRIYMQLLDFSHALQWLKKNAQKGDVAANYLIAEIYNIHSVIRSVIPADKKVRSVG